jgi:hypothetical protein
MAGSRVEEIPADQFNHTVTVMRNKDGSFRVLDPTWSPQSKELWSSREAEQGLVFGTPEGQGLSHSPFFTPDENLIHIKADTTIDAQGDLVTMMRMNMTGYPCTYLRRYSERDPVHQKMSRFEQYLHMGPNADITSMEHIDAVDYSSDGWMNLGVEIDAYAAAGGNVLLFQLPLAKHPLSRLFTPDLLFGFNAAERQYTLNMRATRHVVYEESIKLPAGFTVNDLPEAKTIDTDIASIDFSAEVGGNVLTYTLDVTLKHHKVKPEQYKDFKSVIDAMLEIGDLWIAGERS